MAAPPKKDAGKQGKAGKKGKPVSRFFKISGDKIERINKTCPKCGPGFFLANHKDRESCGHCDYTQFRK